MNEKLQIAVKKARAWVAEQKNVPESVDYALGEIEWSQLEPEALAVEIVRVRMELRLANGEINRLRSLSDRLQSKLETLTQA